MSSELIKCSEDCGYDEKCGDPFFTLYQCSCCEKQFCSDCIACIEGNAVNTKEQKRTCVNCFDTTSVRNCNDCYKLRRCEISTCWRCHKTDICEDCITMYRYDDGEELCTACSQAKDENEKKRERAYREESEKREAEHRRKYPHLFPTFSEKVQVKQNEPK